MTSAYFLGFTFLLRVGLIGFYNRLVVDDFCFLAAVREHGWLGGQIHWYQTWQGRWFSELVIMSVADLMRDTGHLFSYCLVLFLSLVGSLYFLIQIVSSTPVVAGDEKRPQKREVLAIALGMGCILYSVTPDQVESWHWLCGSAIYALPIILAAVLGGFLMRRETNSGRVIIVGLLSAAVCGCGEMMGALTITLLTLRLHWKRDRATLIALASACLSFAVVALSPGNRLRALQVGYHGTFQHSVSLAASETVATMIHIVHGLWPWFLGTLLIWTTLGREWQLTEPQPWKKTLKNSISAIALAVLACFVLLLPSAFALGGNPFTRVWIGLSTALLILSAYLGILLSARANRNRIRWLSAVILPILFTAVGGYQLSLLNRSLTDLRSFSKAYDERFIRLRKLEAEGNRNPVWLEPLPWSGHYKNAGLGAEENWLNRCVQSGMGLSFPVRER